MPPDKSAMMLTSNLIAIEVGRVDDGKNLEPGTEKNWRSSMTLEEKKAEIVETIYILGREMTEIKDRLAKVKNSVREAGVYADADWYRRAQYALRMKAVTLQASNRELGEINRQIRAANFAKSDTPDRRFVSVAKRVLSPETYQHIWDVVHIERTGEENNG